MSLFDKARAALGQAAAAVSRETETLSLQAQLGNLDEESDRVLIEVGKRARELKRQGLLSDPQMDSLLRRVEQIDEEMMELRHKVAGIQTPPVEATAPPPPPPPPPPASATAGPAPVPPAATKTCPKCNNTLSATAHFCDRCGAKIS
ncbi:MAG: zinc ribbon domain-containing protein [Armatimonadia bacterium]